jgi:hypothetical protein
MVEMATTVEILISMGKELGVLGIKHFWLALARAFYCEISLKWKGFKADFYRRQWMFPYIKNGTIRDALQ